MLHDRTEVLFKLALRLVEVGINYATYLFQLYGIYLNLAKQLAIVRS